MKKYAQAVLKNREPILNILKQFMPNQGNILEIASGTGEHSLFFAPHFPQQRWIPSDCTSESLASIKAWGEEYPHDNLQSPLTIDVMERDWFLSLQGKEISAIVCINMIHIAPWEACLGLLAGAGQLLPKDGILYLYGAYKVNNRHTAPSNEEFDRYLRSQNPLWGVRNVEDVEKVAHHGGLELSQTIPMPSNNFSLIFVKKGIKDNSELAVKPANE